jgi:hypothetical protein
MKKALHVVDADTAAASTKELASPARQRLRDLQDQRALHERRAKEAQSSRDRLTEIIQIAVDTKKAITEFDAASMEAAAAWAKRHLDKNPPEVDSNARQKLVVAHAIAQENASAAFAAQKQFTDAMNAEEQAIKALLATMKLAVVDVIIEEASGPVMDDLRQAVAAAVQKQVRLKRAFDVLVAIAHGGEFADMKPAFVKLEQFSETLRLAAAPPAPDGDDHRGAWWKLAVDLETDAAAELEG